VRRGLDSFRPIAGIDCFRTPVIQCNRSTFTRDGKKTYPLALSAFPLETTSVVHHNNLRARKSAGCLDTQAQDSYCGFFSASASFTAAATPFSFATALTLARFAPVSDFSAPIQTARGLLTRARDLSGVKSLQGLIGTDDAHRWCLDALSLGEEHVERLRARPVRSLSIMAQKVIAEWDMVYGDRGAIDSVIAKLQNLSKRYEDDSIRRALYGAIITKHERKWRAIPQLDLRMIEELARRNIEGQCVRDGDLRNWLMAYRHLPTFDFETAIRRLSDWHELRPTAVEPSFYLFVFRVLQWLGTDKKRGGFAEDATRWLNVCKGQRQLGERNWGYEWLLRSEKAPRSVYFKELGFDPVQAIRGGERDKTALQVLGRIVAPLVEYYGPQRGTLDLGHGIRMHVTPLDRLRASRHDLWKTCGAGWDVISTGPCKPISLKYPTISGSA